VLAVADHEVRRHGRGPGDGEDRARDRFLGHEVDLLAALAGLDHRGVVGAHAETLRDAGAAVEVVGADVDARLRVAVQREEIGHVAPDGPAWLE
jgi:hypothetical protein